MSGRMSGRLSRRHRVSGKLAHARPLACVAVVVVYGALSWRGFRHLFEKSPSPAVVFDFDLLVCLYFLETLGAVLFGVSTLKGWSRRHFLEHHLPLVILFLLMRWQNGETNGRALAQHKEWMALVLFISFNEACAALLVVYPSQSLDKLRVLPNILVQLALFCTETTSWFNATSTQLKLQDPDMWISTILTQFLLAAAAVHVSYFRKLVRLFEKLFLAKD